MSELILIDRSDEIDDSLLGLKVHLPDAIYYDLVGETTADVWMIAPYPAMSLYGIELDAPVAMFGLEGVVVISEAVENGVLVGFMVDKRLRKDQIERRIATHYRLSACQVIE